MTRTVYIWDADLGMNIPKDQWLAMQHNRPVPRNFDLGAPSVVSDNLDPTQSMLDGKTYDSKSTLRQTYKAAGVTEVGNDSSILDPKPFKKPRPDPKKIKENLAKAYSQVNLTSNESPWEANPF